MAKITHVVKVLIQDIKYKTSWSERKKLDLGFNGSSFLRGLVFMFHDNGEDTTADNHYNATNLLEYGGQVPQPPVS